MITRDTFSPFTPFISMDEGYRKRMAERYSRLTASQKPSIPLCLNCNQPSYLTHVCGKTGFYHNVQGNSRTVCGVPIDSEMRQVSGSQLVDLISKFRIKWEKSRVGKVLIDESSASLLQSFCQSIQWRPSVHGILYGTFRESEKIVEVHSIYEVEQICTGEGLKEELDSRISNVDNLAKLLGFQRVGVIIAHCSSPGQPTVLGEELLWAIQSQSRFGEDSVIVTLTPDADNESTHVEAWQASQQSVDLFRSQHLCRSEHPGCVHATTAVEIAESLEGKRKADSTSSSHEIDVAWLIAPIAVEAFRSPVLSNLFVRIHRLECQPPSVENLRVFMNDPKRRQLPFLEKVNDFHLLIYLMEQLLDATVDIPLLVHAIQTKDMESVEGIKLIIDSCCDIL
ncbi:NPL4like protein [Perkinsela sp. CCAP 1560/4]|nr:NPL4like protein [Perkinsela sp. CCAP 1560/4]|eukprot:KNH08218.1 NPL4like protein [Perkinsela sp. CCAP 1560/4]